ncbi:MAG: AEC family transporter [Verrucomicrobiota bacterium]
MVEYGTIFSAVLPVFLIIAIGWLMRACGWFSAQGEKDLMKLLIYVLYPCLIFKFILGNELLKDGKVVAEAIGLGYGIIVLGILFVAWIAPLMGIRERRERGTFAFGCSVYNFGYIAIPLASVLFDNDVVGVLLVVNVGIELAIWTVGIGALSGKFSRDSLKKALSPPVLAVLIGLPTNWLGGTELIPGAIITLIEMLAACSIPVGVFIIGVAFCELAQESGARWRPNAIAGGIFLRLILLPAIMIGMAVLVPFSSAIKDVLILHAAMPTGVFAVVLVKHYGGAGNLAFQVAAATNLISLFTIPLWVQLGLSIVAP